MPVHPNLATILERWKAEGWKRYVGSDPTPEDLIVPSDRGKRRSASCSNRQFQDDVRKLGLEKKGSDGQAVRRTHYETRATFRSLALAGGAVREDLDLITHPSPRQASDLYTRLDEVWPLLCRAVNYLEITPREPPDPFGQVTAKVTDHGHRKEEGPNVGTLGPFELAGCTGLDPVASGVTGRRYNRLN